MNGYGSDIYSRRYGTISPPSPQIDDIIKSIRNGYRILILMRGPSGSGKSYLAKQIIDQTIGGVYPYYILSTDDHFYDGERYNYNRNDLQEAHKVNRAKVAHRMREGWSPIIVDNTNIKLWEMLPYVRAGVDHGYLIEMLESGAPWAKSAAELAARNQHNVSQETIERMLRNYERTTVNEFLRAHNLEYNRKVPMLRNFPPYKKL